MNQIIKVQVIESLCQLRKQLLTAFQSQLEAVRLCHQVTTSIDSAIPAHSDSNYDYMSIVFLQFKGLLKEDFKRNSPKDVNIVGGNINSMMSEFTKLVDAQLWSMLFNRLNIYSLMSSNAKAEFKQQLTSEHRIFSVDSVQATLTDLLNRQSEMLYNSLFDCLNENPSQFASNSDRRFNKRTVFKNATFLQNGVYYQLSNDSKLMDSIRFLSKTVFAENKRFGAIDGIVSDLGLIEEVKASFVEDGPFTKLNNHSIYFNGGRIDFYNNFRAHLHLEPEIVSFLNNKLSEFNYLPDAQG